MFKSTIFAGWVAFGNASDGLRDDYFAVMCSDPRGEMLTIRDLRHDHTIEELKQNVVDLSKNWFDKDEFKLVHRGQILNDRDDDPLVDKRLAEYNIGPTSTIEILPYDEQFGSPVTSLVQMEAEGTVHDPPGNVACDDSDNLESGSELDVNEKAVIDAKLKMHDAHAALEFVQSDQLGVPPNAEILKPKKTFAQKMKQFFCCGCKEKKKQELEEQISVEDDLNDALDENINRVFASALMLAKQMRADLGELTQQVHEMQQGGSVLDLYSISDRLSTFVNDSLCKQMLDLAHGEQLPEEFRRVYEDAQSLLSDCEQLKEENACSVCHLPFDPRKNTLQPCHHCCDDCLQTRFCTPKVDRRLNVGTAIEEFLADHNMTPCWYPYKVDQIALAGLHGDCPVCRAPAPKSSIKFARRKLPSVPGNIAARLAMADAIHCACVLGQGNPSRIKKSNQGIPVCENMHELKAVGEDSLQQDETYRCSCCAAFLQTRNGLDPVVEIELLQVDVRTESGWWRCTHGCDFNICDICFSGVACPISVNEQHAADEAQRSLADAAESQQPLSEDSASDAHPPSDNQLVEFNDAVLTNLSDLVSFFESAVAASGFEQPQYLDSLRQQAVLLDRVQPDVSHSDIVHEKRLVEVVLDKLVRLDVTGVRFERPSIFEGRQDVVFSSLVNLVAFFERAIAGKEFSIDAKHETLRRDAAQLDAAYPYANDVDVDREKVLVDLILDGLRNSGVTGVRFERSPVSKIQPYHDNGVVLTGFDELATFFQRVASAPNIPMPPGQRSDLRAVAALMHQRADGLKAEKKAVLSLLRLEFSGVTGVRFSTDRQVFPEDLSDRNVLRAHLDRMARMFKNVAVHPNENVSDEIREILRRAAKDMQGENENLTIEQQQDVYLRAYDAFRTAHRGRWIFSK